MANVSRRFSASKVASRVFSSAHTPSKSARILECDRAGTIAYSQRLIKRRPVFIGLFVLADGAGCCGVRVCTPDKSKLIGVNAEAFFLS